MRKMIGMFRICVFESNGKAGNQDVALGSGYQISNVLVILRAAWGRWANVFSHFVKGLVLFMEDI